LLVILQVFDVLIDGFDEFIFHFSSSTLVFVFFAFRASYVYVVYIIYMCGELRSIRARFSSWSGVCVRVCTCVYVCVRVFVSVWVRVSPGGRVFLRLHSCATKINK
jgi:hypothetical protein